MQWHWLAWSWFRLQNWFFFDQIIGFDAWLGAGLELVSIFSDLLEERGQRPDESQSFLLQASPVIIFHITRLGRLACKLVRILTDCESFFKVLKDDISREKCSVTIFESCHASVFSSPQLWLTIYLTKLKVWAFGEDPDLVLKEHGIQQGKGTEMGLRELLYWSLS